VGEESEHRCEAGLVGLQLDLYPVKSPLLEGGQAHGMAGKVIGRV
jgi:hypothetical protein